LRRSLVPWHTFAAYTDLLQLSFQFRSAV
jgi:hypothetical protein